MIARQRDSQRRQCGSTRWLAVGWLGLAAAVALAARAYAADAPVPLPEMVVTKASVPPVIDGKIAPGEWDQAAVCTGFVRAFEGGLAPCQSVARVMYDDRYLYVAFTNFRGKQLTFLQKKGRKVDDDAIVFDPSNEVWITPPGLPQTTYQTLFNAYPAVLDAKVIPSVGYTSRAWQGHWEIAATETRDSWTVEARAPLSVFGVKEIEDGATWRGLFTADVFQDGGAFRAWAAGGAFADIPRHGFLHFRANSAVVQVHNIESLFTGQVDFPLAVTGPAHGAAEVTVTARFGAAVEPGQDDVVLRKTLTVRDAQHVEFHVATDLAQAKLPRRTIVLDPKAQPKVEKDCPCGYCTLDARAADGAVLYRQVVPFVVNGLVRQPPEKIVTSPYDTPFGIQAQYAPLSRKLLVKIDRLYLPQRAEAVGGRVTLADPATGKVIAERALAPFREDYSEFYLDLANLAVPVETEQNWQQAKPKPAEYRLAATLTRADGAALATTAMPVALLGQQFEWLGNTIGISDQVILPWTAMTWRDGVAGMWNKTYRLNGLGLAEKIDNAGAAQLSGAMKLVATLDGREVELAAPPPTLQKGAEAGLDLTGSATAAGLTIQTTTRVEFDGFVLNTMTLAPTTARVDDLSLIVTMPEAEAPCFVTTSGGWSAYHGWTPGRWDSREMALGSLVGNFVPYLFLTDSERGFCWFADNERDWILDPAKPTQELSRAQGRVTLRVHFVNRPGPIAQPTMIRYGWMVSPSKPQPRGWRATVIAQDKPAPPATAVFWNDADWAVLWPYYSSPFPRDYEKSRKLLEGSRARGYVPMVGNIAHAIARYQDYKGRSFPALVADWGNTPGDPSNGNVARSRGPNDFQLWHFDRWVRLAGLPGIYFDENYLSEDWNYLTGGAYLRPDQRVQPGYSYLGLREYNKRLRYLFAAHGQAPPNLWLHTTSGQPVYAWMPDVAMEGENVEPAGGDNDYLECLPAGRIRAIDMGRNLGAAPLVMCQAQRHGKDADTPFLIRQLVGWLLAHDTLPEGVAFWHTLVGELEMWRDDVRFLPYWKSGQGFGTSTPDVLVSAHAGPGRAVLWVVNTARQDRAAEVRVDLAALGLDRDRPLRVFDAETGEAYALSDGVVHLALPPRDWRAVRLVQPKALAAGQTFVAHFDGAATADECLGNAYPRVRGGEPALTDGRTGRAVALDQPVSFETRLHVTRDRGAVALWVRCDPATARGTLVTLGEFRLTLGQGALTIYGPATVTGKDGKASRQSVVVATSTLPAGTGGGVGWHEVKLTWTGVQVRVAVDGAAAVPALAAKRVLTAELTEPMPVPAPGRGLEIRGGRGRADPPVITFGPLPGGALDDLTMGW